MANTDYIYSVHFHASNMMHDEFYVKYFDSLNECAQYIETISAILEMPDWYDIIENETAKYILRYDANSTDADRCYDWINRKY